MIPSIVASELQEAIRRFLYASFPMTTPGFRQEILRHRRKTRGHLPMTEWPEEIRQVSPVSTPGRLFIRRLLEIQRVSFFPVAEGHRCPEGMK